MSPTTRRTDLPRHPRTASVVALFTMTAALFACGGGGGDAPAPWTAPAAGTPPATGTPTVPPLVGSPAAAPAESPAAALARVAGVDLIQSFVYPSTDPASLLVADRDVIVKVNATTTDPAGTRPSGTLRIENSTGSLIQEVPLTVPTVPLQATVPVVPDFQRFYTATVPASAVKTGLRLKVALRNGQVATLVTPKVGAANPITLVAVPVRLQTTTGVPMAGAHDYLAARAPVSKVTLSTHAVYTSPTVTTLPTSNAQWETAMDDVLEEMLALHNLENASNRTYYYGFLPKRSFGITGLGYVGAPAAVGIDFPAEPDVVLTTMVHEVGHNFTLPHAPCGVGAGSDPAYPYPNATLGAGTRFIWGYNKLTNKFVDPRVTTQHDVMSYCDGDTFSDFNYRRIQGALTPADKLASNTAASVKAAEETAVEQAPQELLLISGRITGDTAVVRAVKAFSGTPRPSPAGTYVLRLETATATVDHPFAPLSVDHAPDAAPFQLAVPNPGSLRVMQVRTADGKVLFERRAGVSAAADQVKAASVSSSTSAEAGGVLQVTWDASAHPSLTVIHVGATRTVLAQDLSGGKAELPTAELPAGGNFELIFSDGLNAVRKTAPRGAK